MCCHIVAIKSKWNILLLPRDSEIPNLFIFHIFFKKVMKKKILDFFRPRGGQSFHDPGPQYPMLGPVYLDRELRELWMYLLTFFYCDI